MEATNNIVPTGKRFEPTPKDLEIIKLSPQRAIEFSNSKCYRELLEDLESRVLQFENEILVAALIEDVKTRGNIIEYLIAGEDVQMRNGILTALMEKKPLPRPYLQDGLGDYSKKFTKFNTETDIKTKIMIHFSSPKGYNIDKILEFLSEENSVFMIFFLGIDYENKSIKTKLVSMFQSTLLSTTIIQSHWAGRNSRGVSQFQGNSIKQIILHEDNVIDLEFCHQFLDKILSL